MNELERRYKTVTQKSSVKLDMVVHACNFSTQETEGGR
jgi:enoyl-[acyl-carrier-protein] reductase (NADH)